MSAGAFLDLASNVEQFALSNVQADYEQKINDESFAKNQAILNENALQNLRDAPLASVQGLRKAGLSPAFMQPATNVSPGVAPIGNAKTKPVKGFDYNSLAIMSQVKRNEAETDLIRTEAEAQDLENRKNSAADLAVDKKYRETLEQTKAQLIEAGNLNEANVIDGMLRSDYIYGRGIVEGFRQWDDFKTIVSNNELQRNFRNVLEKVVTDEKLSDESTLYRIAHLSDAEFDKVIAGTAELLSESARNYAQAQEASASAHDKTTHAALNLQEIRNLKDGDIAELVSDGEWLRVFSKVGYDALNQVIGLIGVGGKAKMARSTLEQLQKMKDEAKPPSPQVKPSSMKETVTFDKTTNTKKRTQKWKYNSF